jgi:hypothetical protein
MTPSLRRVPATLFTVLILGLGVAASANPPAAIPNTDPAHQRAERSFNEFAKGWMQKMARVESENRAHPKLASNGNASYRGYADDFQIELKPTGSSTAPWVGILRYNELLYSCADRVAKACSPSKTTRVTEIFRFQGGKWVY